MHFKGTFHLYLAFLEYGIDVATVCVRTDNHKHHNFLYEEKKFDKTDDINKFFVIKSLK